MSGNTLLDLRPSSWMCSRTYQLSVTRFSHQSQLTYSFSVQAGTSFAGKNALLTGVGRGSIGVEILRGLLAGGAKVIITTSRYSVSF